MKGYLLTSITILLLITGCQNSSGTKMTQKISENSLISSQENNENTTDTSNTSNTDDTINTSDTSNTSNTSNTNNTTNTQNTQNTSSETQQNKSYEDVKAEKNAVEAEIDALEADYRVGKIGTDEFKNAKKELEIKKDALDDMEDDMEDHMEDHMEENYSQSNNFVLGTTVEELLNQKRQKEIEEEYLDDQEDIIKNEYKAGKITRDEFVEKQKQISTRDEELDVLDDMVDDALDRLGYDD